MTHAGCTSLFWPQEGNGEPCHPQRLDRGWLSAGARRRRGDTMIMNAIHYNVVDIIYDMLLFEPLDLVIDKSKGIIY